MERRWRGVSGLANGAKQITKVTHVVDDRKTTGSLCDDVTGVRRAREMRGETKEGRRAIGDLKKYLR